MSNLLINEPPILLLPTLAKLIGLNEAIVLQQLHYWLNNPKIGKWHGGRKWIYNSVRQWQSENFPFWSEATINRTLHSLRAKGIICAENLNTSGYDRTLWYTIDYDQLVKLQECTLSDCTNANRQVDEIETDDLPKPIPETTPLNNIERKNQQHSKASVPDESANIAWTMSVRFCGGDEREAGLIWKLMGEFSKVTTIKIPYDSEAGRDQLLKDWWPFLRQILRQSDNNLELAAAAIREAQVEMDSSSKNLTLASPKSIVKKAIGAIGRQKRQGNGATNGVVVKGPANNGQEKRPKGWDTVAQRREEILRQQKAQSSS